MSEAWVDRGGAAPTAAAPEGPSAGAMLRQAREAAGLHLAAMAVALKVPPGKLEALEQDRYELLPDAVFARALASTVCRTLKIDAAPVLARLPRTAAPRLPQTSDGINAPFRSPRDTVAPRWRQQLTRPVTLAVGALLLGALVVTLLPHDPAGGGDGPVATGEPAEQPVAAPMAVASPAPAAATAPDRAATGPAAAALPAGGIVAASISVPAPADAPAAVVVEAPAAVSAEAPAAPAGVVVFRARGESWVEVRDANGVVAVRKLLAAGEAAAASGAMPLQVTVGNAGATEVQVRGKPFDLRRLARDNVARFEVK